MRWFFRLLLPLLFQGKTLRVSGTAPVHPDCHGAPLSFRSFIYWNKQRSRWLHTGFHRGTARTQRFSVLLPQLNHAFPGVLAPAAAGGDTAVTRRLPPPLHHGGGGKLGQSELCPVRARARAHHPRRLRPGPALRRSSPRPACPPPSLLPPPRPSAAAAGEEEPGLLGGGWSGDVCAPVYFVIFCAPRRPGGARVGGGGGGCGRAPGGRRAAAAEGQREERRPRGGDGCAPAPGPAPSERAGWGLRPAAAWLIPAPCCRDINISFIAVVTEWLTLRSRRAARLLRPRSVVLWVPSGLVGGDRSSVPLPLAKLCRSGLARWLTRWFSANRSFFVDSPHRSWFSF